MLLLIAFIGYLAITGKLPFLAEILEPPHIVVKVPVHQSTDGGYMASGDCYKIPEKYNFCMSSYWREKKSRALSEIRLGKPITIDASSLQQYKGRMYEVWLDGVIGYRINYLLINPELVKEDCRYDSDDREYRCYKWYRGIVIKNPHGIYNCWFDDGVRECQRFPLKLPNSVIKEIEEKGTLKIYTVSWDKDRNKYGHVEGYLDVEQLAVKVRVECTKDSDCLYGRKCINYMCVGEPTTTTTIPPTPTTIPSPQPKTIFDLIIEKIKSIINWILGLFR